MIAVGINGFGRIGRNFLRAVLKDKNASTLVRVVAINVGKASIKNLAHMFTYDTLMGKFSGTVRIEGTNLMVDDYRIALISELDPLQINWKQLGVQWVVESSGHFTKRAGAEKHLKAGAEYVLITAPATDEDVSIIPGVNEELFDPQKHHIVSLGSCTTNALVPTLRVLHDTFEVVHGMMTTIHAYTNSQVLLDVEEDDDVRRSRAAALNIIPTTTGASDMVKKVIPALAGKIDAMSIRVPVGKCSIIDLVVQGTKKMSTETIHEAFTRAQQGRMKGVLALSYIPLVSSDYAGNDHSVIIDAELTQVQGSLAKVFGWYDNEWGYSVRLKDFLCYAAQKK